MPEKIFLCPLRDVLPRKDDAQTLIIWSRDSRRWLGLIPPPRVFPPSSMMSSFQQRSRIPLCCVPRFLSIYFPLHIPRTFTFTYKRNVHSHSCTHTQGCTQTHAHTHKHHTLTLKPTYSGMNAKTLIGPPLRQLYKQHLNCTSKYYTSSSKFLH